MFQRSKGFTLIELLIVVAIIAILAAIAVPNFLEAQTRSKVSRVRSDLRSLATALEAYYIDNNSYPAHNVTNQTASCNYDAFTRGSLATVPSFRIRQSQDDVVTLTTPVAYITSYFADPFADTKGYYFNYGQSEADTFGSAWVTWSFGPDTDEAISIPDLSGGTLDAVGGDIGVTVTGESATSDGFVLQAWYNPNVSNPTQNLLLVTYDPTNGTTSNGDVYRLKQ